MAEQSVDEFIEFNNLVQAVRDVAGYNQPVRTRKETIEESRYAQENTIGELYRPTDLDDVKDRAIKAGRRFNILFN